MKVMTKHNFFDEEVQKVVWNDCHTREIHHDAGSLILNKEDVIALAKEFELVVFEQDAQL